MGGVFLNLKLHGQLVIVTIAAINYFARNKLVTGVVIM